MRSAFFGLHVASSGLHTARGVINVTSHNLANEQINGYTRQVAQMQAARPLTVGSGRGMYGTGSQITSIIQIRDRFLDKKFWSQSAVFSQFTTVNTHLGFVETVFNEMPDVGVKRTFYSFFATIQDLTTRAHEATFRTNVTTTAHSLTEQIRQNAYSLQRQQLDLNREFADIVVTINSLGQQIADVNKQIHIFERDGSNANDLRDQRALLIDELSKLVNVQVEERDFSRPGMSNDRRLSVMINGEFFVDHTMINRMQLVARDNPHDSRSGTRRNEMDVAGLYDIYFELTDTPFNLYSRTLGGQLRGIIDVRDGNGGQITASPIFVGAAIIETQLDALLRSRNFLNTLSTQLGTFSLIPLVNQRDDHLADLNVMNTAMGSPVASPIQNTSQARAFVNYLQNRRVERQGLNASLAGLRSGFISGVGLTALRSSINTAIGLSANPDVADALDAIQTHLNTITTVVDDATLTAFTGQLNTLFNDLVTELGTPPPPVLADILTTIADIQGNIDNLAQPLEDVFERLDEIETAYGDEATLDAAITSADGHLSALTTAIAGISEITTMAERIELQLNWAIGNAQEMANLIQERIDTLNGQNPPGITTEYQAFLDALQDEIDRMRAFADNINLPPTLGVYSPAAELQTLVTELTASLAAATGFPDIIDDIVAAVGTSGLDTVLPPTGYNPLAHGVTTNFKGIPFYMNQLNHLVRTFARAINEGRNTNVEDIPGSIGHIFGFDANGENRNALLFTYQDPITGNTGVMVDDDPFRSLRMWIISSDPTNPNAEPLRDANGNMVTVFGPNPPDDVARDSMGRPLFTLDYSQFNALNMVVNPELMTDPDLLAASSNQNIGQANNDVIHGFLAVFNDNSLFREGRLIDFIIATNNHLAVDNHQALMFSESYEEITMQTHNHRLSVSSVDKEEEMMNLVRFQNMFISISKLINVIDTIYDTLINRLGNF